IFPQVRREETQGATAGCRIVGRRGPILLVCLSLEVSAMPMGERIREARRKKGLSQEEVARELGISRQAVTKWEGEQSAPSAGNLKKLAALLETTPGRLLNGDTGE